MLPPQVENVTRDRHMRMIGSGELFDMLNIRQQQAMACRKLGPS